MAIAFNILTTTFQILGVQYLLQECDNNHEIQPAIRQKNLGVVLLKCYNSVGLNVRRRTAKCLGNGLAVPHQGFKVRALEIQGIRITSVLTCPILLQNIINLQEICGTIRQVSTYVTDLYYIQLQVVEAIFSHLIHLLPFSC